MKISGVGKKMMFLANKKVGTAGYRLRRDKILITEFRGRPFSNEQFEAELRGRGKE